ncbi:uncharacterized protein NECHADRAFT_79969 [Fusarium vanettenii 77-13-4]|uniref:Uncharacterized protein n=1 Tax=Fusarium vanettenii (strain ATCC MYA-4622 / CBS 123669 / FGSC 9596 / NRRL 45880 / 77-13-4) TaxID=660122 RepID=C7Z0P9_FUSV7|nr:uncharacterized protein NECHADRAFT_79969 [Fusarium vanettenii 77-13-4]EEU42420.1 predicted protein [Fusarium vanettenii 77-13-4]
MPPFRARTATLNGIMLKSDCWRWVILGEGTPWEENWTMIQIPDEEYINGIAATFETDPITGSEVSQLFGHARSGALPPQDALLALVPAQACKILGFLPKKALWSTCGRLGWSKAGFPPPHGSRASQDQYLLDRRADGYTYKEIKEAGGFSEAAPTSIAFEVPPGSTTIAQAVPDLMGLVPLATSTSLIAEPLPIDPALERNFGARSDTREYCATFVAWDLSPLLQARKCWVARPAPESLVHERPCSSALASLRKGLRSYAAKGNR